MGKITLAVLCVFLVLFLMLEITLSLGSAPVDAQTKAVCKELGAENTLVYAHTEFNHMDFYQSCIDNIHNTSPLMR